MTKRNARIRDERLMCGHWRSQVRVDPATERPYCRDCGHPRVTGPPADVRGAQVELGPYHRSEAKGSHKM